MRSNIFLSVSNHMYFFRMNLVLKMSLLSLCVTLLFCVLFFSYSFVISDDVYMQDNTDFPFITVNDARNIIDRLMKHIPERVLYSSGPTFDVPLNPFDISGKAKVTYSVLQGLEKLQITDFFFNEDTNVLKAVANFDHIVLSMNVQSSLEWNSKKTEHSTAMRFDLYKWSLELRGHFNGAKIWDTFVEVATGSVKVNVMQIFRNATLTHEISDYLEENLPRMIRANRNLVSNIVNRWAETGINTLLQKTSQ